MYILFIFETLFARENMTFTFFFYWTSAFVCPSVNDVQQDWLKVWTMDNRVLKASSHAS